jgi:hypothetical protein
MTDRARHAIGHAFAGGAFAKAFRTGKRGKLGTNGKADGGKNHRQQMPRNGDGQQFHEVGGNYADDVRQFCSL